MSLFHKLQCAAICMCVACNKKACAHVNVQGLMKEGVFHAHDWNVLPDALDAG